MKLADVPSALAMSSSDNWSDETLKISTMRSIHPATAQGAFAGVATTSMGRYFRMYRDIQ